MPETERQFEAAVIEFAKLNGWLVYHTHDSRRSAPGFPDLVLVRDGCLVIAELKTDKGRVSPAQQEWLDQLAAVSTAAGRQSGTRAKPGQPAVAVWRPRSWSSVEFMLSRRPA